ncbi:histidine kinase dimerization/phospho-acceptor domain-containing protein [Microbispora sp. NPDC046973]|uniref:sensor histidine kinase n=1 Tax=Microbispora sp. NPDC046973 TaxID=3155022 RepID=UPI00340DD8D3
MMCTALLAAVSHDLRTPLATARAAVESLGATTDVDWSADDREELLATADESLYKLDRLVANPLDMSRLQAGVLGLSLQPVALEEIVPRSIDDLGPRGELRDGGGGEFGFDFARGVIEKIRCECGSGEPWLAGALLHLQGQPFAPICRGYLKVTWPRRVSRRTRNHRSRNRHIDSCRTGCRCTDSCRSCVRSWHWRDRRR